MQYRAGQYRKRHSAALLHHCTRQCCTTVIQGDSIVQCAALHHCVEAERLLCNVILQYYKWNIVTNISEETQCILVAPLCVSAERLLWEFPAVAIELPPNLQSPLLLYRSPNIAFASTLGGTLFHY